MHFGEITFNPVGPHIPGGTETDPTHTHTPCRWNSESLGVRAAASPPGPSVELLPLW